MATEIPLDVWLSAGVNLVRIGAAPTPAPPPMPPKPAWFDAASPIGKRAWLLEAKAWAAKKDARAASARAAPSRPEGFANLSPIDKLTVLVNRRGVSPGHF